jgi:hypothetical protein
MDEQNTKPEMSEDQVLAYTQGKRRVIIDKLTEAGKVPDEKTEVSLLVSALDGMDRAALTQKRIKADEKSAQGMAGAANIIAKLLTQVNSKGKNTDLENSSSAPLTLGDEIPAPNLVPGETEITPGQMDFDSFTASFQNESNAS